MWRKSWTGADATTRGTAYWRLMLELGYSLIHEDHFAGVLTLWFK